MEYNLKTGPGGTEIVLSGRLTFDAHAKCRALIEELDKMESGRRVIDLKGVDFIDSSGLGLILRIAESSKAGGCSVALRAPSDGQVAQLMKVAKFGELVPFEA